MTLQEKERIKNIKNNIHSVVSVNVFVKNKSNKTTKTFLDGGSGFIASKKGIIITSVHVIHKNGLLYEITTRENKKYEANLIESDLSHDIAFLKITTTDKLRPVKLGNSAKLEIGQDVISIGNALGLFSYTVSKGIISGLFRSIEASGNNIEESLHKLIQTDVSINPGDSGGPLIDSDGNVIGMNSAMTYKAENINFAIPINAIKDDLREIEKNGKLNKPFLGIRYVLLNKKTAKSLGIKQDYGALITSPFYNKNAVLKGSPADIATIKSGDIITHINSTAINNEHPLHKILKNETEKDRKITLTLVRKNKKIIKVVKL